MQYSPTKRVYDLWFSSHYNGQKFFFWVPERTSPSIANFIRPMGLANSDHFDNTPATPSELLSTPGAPAVDPLEDNFLSSFNDRLRLPPSITQIPDFPHDYPPLEPSQRPRSVPMPRNRSPLLTQREERETEPKHDSAPMRFNYRKKLFFTYYDYQLPCDNLLQLFLRWVGKPNEKYLELLQFLVTLILNRNIFSSIPN